MHQQSAAGRRSKWELVHHGSAARYFTSEVCRSVGIKLLSSRIKTRFPARGSVESSSVYCSSAVSAGRLNVYSMGTYLLYSRLSLMLKIRCAGCYQQTLSSLAALSTLYITYLDYIRVSTDEPGSTLLLFFEFEVMFHHHVLLSQIMQLPRQLQCYHLKILTTMLMSYFIDFLKKSLFLYFFSPGRFVCKLC